MDPDEEYITIASAEEQMSQTAVARKKELDTARSKMKGASHPSTGRLSQVVLLLS